jgi:hypothetical protein
MTDKTDLIARIKSAQNTLVTQGMTALSEGLDVVAAAVRAHVPEEQPSLWRAIVHESDSITVRAFTEEDARRLLVERYHVDLSTIISIRQVL